MAAASPVPATAVPTTLPATTAAKRSIGATHPPVEHSIGKVPRLDLTAMDHFSQTGTKAAIVEEDAFRILWGWVAFIAMIRVPGIRSTLSMETMQTLSSMMRQVCQACGLSGMRFVGHV